TGKVYREYDNRVLRAPDVPEEKKQELRERKVELLQQIYQLTKKFDRAYKNKYHRHDEDE
ncbi:MAG: hypothetical protein ACUVQT_02290, partial [bacterium]